MRAMLWIFEKDTDRQTFFSDAKVARGGLYVPVCVHESSYEKIIHFAKRSPAEFFLSFFFLAETSKTYILCRPIFVCDVVHPRTLGRSILPNTQNSNPDCADIS